MGVLRRFHRAFPNVKDEAHQAPSVNSKCMNTCLQDCKYGYTRNHGGMSRRLGSSASDYQKTQTEQNQRCIDSCMEQCDEAHMKAAEKAKSQHKQAEKNKNKMKEKKKNKKKKKQKTKKKKVLSLYHC